MTIEPFKYLIQPVAVERDETGRIVRELPGEVATVYGVAEAIACVEQFERAISEMDGGEMNGSRPRVGDKDQLRQSELSGERP